MKIAVIAGTPVDTQMGMNYLNRKAPDIETLFLPCADTPRECHVFQMAKTKDKHDHMKKLFKKALDGGADHFFIYCNSLSTTIDFPTLATEMNVHCITPLDAYRIIAKRYNNIGLIAANNQATAGIEKTFTEANPDCYVMGLGMLKLVENIESGFRNEGPEYSPEAITKRLKIAELCDFFKSNGAQALVLGCTHFPYIKSSLLNITSMTVIDPADIMFELMQ